MSTVLLCLPAVGREEVAVRPEVDFHKYHSYLTFIHPPPAGTPSKGRQQAQLPALPKGGQSIYFVYDNLISYISLIFLSF